MHDIHELANNFMNKLYFAFDNNKKLSSIVRNNNSVNRNKISTEFYIINSNFTYGNITTNNYVECKLKEKEYNIRIRDLDDFGSDEMQNTSNDVILSLIKESDELIINELNQATENIVVADTGLKKSKIFSALEILNKNKFPDDGQRFAIVGMHQWDELLNIKEFSNAGYAGDSYPLLKGTEARRWMGVNWIMHNSLPLSGNDRTCFIYHKNAVGYASNFKNAPLILDKTFDNQLIFKINQGAKLIANSGVVKILCNEK